MTTETKILTDATKEAVDEAIATALGDAYDCTRTWGAWSYGTMGPDDFSLVAEDSDRLREITDAAIQAILQSPEVQAWKKDAERYRAWRQAAIDEDTIFLDAAYKYQEDNFPEGSPTVEQFDAGLDYAIDAAKERQP